MSLDFRKTTYRPNRPHTRQRTSYGGMSKWMKLYEDGSNVVKRPDLPTSLYIQDPAHMQYDHQAGYDDFHKAYRHLESHNQSLFPVFGPPRLRYGRAGGSWRHVKEVMQARGRRTLFVDGQIRNEDNDRLDEVPGGNLLQPSGRPTLQHGRTCHVMEGNRTTPEANQNNYSVYGQLEPVGLNTGYQRHSRMALR